ncbi:hypothetical protein RIF29_34640 [Crotalaria pallida]|uniref:RING/U-box protein n=1 Tax=Crotalaria pallida TaxID=3830 RepID=A0AAN9E9L7_CROPI
MEAEAEADADFAMNDMLALTHELDPFDDANNIDNVVLDGERCGICMDVVIDRGVLDCCQHWFCFACIDNWATITNLCPLCQNEFQLITCVPVYDTIGSNKVEDDSLFREDDWSIEGKSNTLSFPSYYIDENAVICLDGDGCKVRSGSASIEEDSGLDTSIACDSCDIWYHAFCVGFDTEDTSDSTWLCPRCVAGEVSKGTDTNSVERAAVEYNAENSNGRCEVEDSFSRKVSVSVADTGETAVVVSMVDGNKWVPSTSKKGSLPLEVERNSLNKSDILMSDTNNEQRGTEKTIMLSIKEEQDLELSLSNNISCSLTSKSLVHNDLKKSTHGAMGEQSSFDGKKLFDESHVKTSPSRNESNLGLHLGLSVGSFLSADKADENETKDQTTDVLQLSPEKPFLKVDKADESEAKDQATDVPHLSPGKTFLKGDETGANAHKDNAGVTGGKRKHVECSYDQVHIKVDDGDAKPESQKKIRAADSQMISAADALLSDDAKKHPELKPSPTREVTASNIMSVVKGTNRRVSKGSSGTNACDKLSEKRENMAGLRVKKIMKRASEDGESSLVVQNLRKEIREAVRDKSSINFEDNHFDTKLLEAFRAAIAPKTEPINKLSPSALKAKKSMLQKGKVREHLTKKIFGTSNGRRKRAWDRDCEIEFWKYRCMRASKPEKVETLKSVLDLLRKSSENPESNQGSECRAKDPILSRLYLADTSVFPRKDDVKPLSILKTSASSEQTKQNNPSGKGSHVFLDNNASKTSEASNHLSKMGNCSSERKADKKIVHGSAGDNSASGKTLVSSSAGAKVETKELGQKSDSTKIDKKKWALEILARKTAAASKNAANETQEDNAIFKGNYPLLAQLPTDMRPVLAPCRHNKIPISVRQTQLYRLTERLLRNTNLSVICRTADTELAVADATNIEKEVADRSSSKLVYLNLCSQELLHRTNNTKSTSATDANPPASSAVPTDQPEQNNDDLSNDPEVETALKNAGLLSDSPPSSPQENREICKDEMSGPDNVLELDSHPELDIYGDFEYDLEDEDYIGITKVSNSKQEENDSKVKLVFSTMNMQKSDIALDCADRERSENNEVPQVASSSPNCHSDAVHIDSTTDAEIGQPSVSSELPLGEGTAEPFDSEFEELYGPDKEPLIKKFPDAESRTLRGDGKTETVSEANDCHNKDVSVTAITDKSCNASETGEDASKMEEKSEITAKQSDSANHVPKKVEAYIKEHVRPLCKSGVITAEQYRWAVAKTTEKVMKYHSKAKNASFLIKEGEKVKKLAEQYVEAAQQNRKN